MDHSQRGPSNDSSNLTSNLMPNVLFREIHKNAFLKRHSSDRRTGFPRKSEKVWVVFCVHDDVEPFLEIYPDQKVALTHKPEWFASLSNVLHVSPTICGHEDEFEFAVTLSFQVVRLSAPSWESMMEWVETIRNKLRELKVLCPKENLYSKMPEQKQPLLPTRDPNSPLPLPPEGPSTLLPGVELVHVETRNNSNNDSERNIHSRNPISHERRVPKRRENSAESRSVTHNELPSNSTSALNENHHNILEVVPPSDLQQPKPRVKRAVSVPQPSPSAPNIPSSSNVTVIEVSTSSGKNAHSVSDCNQPLIFDISDDNDDDVFAPNSQNADVRKSIPVNSSADEVHYEHVFLSSVPIGKPQVPPSSDSKTSVNCIPVNGNKLKKAHATSVLISPNHSNHINSSQDENVASTSSASSSNVNARDITLSNLTCVNINGNSNESGNGNNPLSPQTQSKLEKVNIAGLIPRVPAKSLKSVPKPMPGSSKETDVKRRSPERPSPQVALVSENRIVNGESNRNSIPGSSAIYSQPVKISKGKNRDVELRNGNQPSIQAISLVPPKRNVNEIQELENHGKKSECSPMLGKNQIPKSGNKKPETSVVIRDAGRSQSGPGTSSSETPSAAPATSGNRDESTTRINLIKKEPLGQSSTAPEVEPITATVQPAVGVISVEDIPLIGGHQRRRRRSSSSDAAPASNIVPPSRGIGGADRIRINVPLTGNPPAREIHHRNEGETRLTSHTRNLTEQNSHINIVSQSSRLTLREQQVLQLKKEMMHPGGVRLQLRKKDCVGSIALVDVLNGVWIAGWKQKEHPLLYNALHIGDQLISVGDVVVRNSAEAQKLIRSSTNLYVEFIIRRVPFGNVFALQRNSEGQNLGIIQEGNTAEIKDILPNSVAARQGLTSKTPSSDGLSLTSWFLTEINGRPLNLFFKDNEVRDRLNAVGKEISILVQPHDFIKQIKKQLKNMRSYKEYIVQ